MCEVVCICVQVSMQCVQMPLLFEVIKATVLYVKKQSLY